MVCVFLATGNTVPGMVVSRFWVVTIFWANMAQKRELINEKSAWTWRDAKQVIRVEKANVRCAGHLESDAADDAKIKRKQKQFNTSLAYATALTSWCKCIFVSRLLALIETDSRKFELLRSEIWSAFINRYGFKCDTAREKTKLFSEQFLDVPVDTSILACVVHW